MVSHWWSGRTSLERVNAFTRWPLYVFSASEPAVALLLLGSEPGVQLWRAAVLLGLSIIHTVACVALLHAVIGHSLGGRRPAARLVGLIAALTAVGIAVAFGVTGGFPFAVLFCAGLTAAACALLNARQLTAVVVGPALALGFLQFATGNEGNSAPWALQYLWAVGLVAFTFRPSVWILSMLWEIDRSRDVQARLAVAEERLRFARDLHDVLGRNLALIAVNSELAAQLVRRGQDGAVEHMREVQQVAQDSMREVRELVGGYRNTDLDTELAGARSLLRSAGIDVRVIGDGAGLSADAQAALGWVVREATTNIIRHSDATTVQIELDVKPDTGRGSTAVLRIENDGVRTSEPSSGTRAGTGLVGLRERLAGLGGEITAEAISGDRFVAQVRLPLRREVPATAVPAQAQP